MYIIDKKGRPVNQIQSFDLTGLLAPYVNADSVTPAYYNHTLLHIDYNTHQFLAQGK